MTSFNIEFNHDVEAWKEELPNVGALIKAACINSLNASGVTDYADVIDISIMLTDDQTIQDLNNEYRGKDKPTNVLSFPTQKLAAGEYESVDEHLMLGDIIFAFETIKAEAAEQETDLGDYLSHLAVHGTLHLLGFDHKKDAEANEMEALETEILEEMGIDNPYL